eukprot:XP_011663451.1 PREDICTED: phosphatidylinositol 4-phosphate 3-kinase C2 domain-containing subunit beta-like [Strongylocentrotus purpuratus]
MFAVTACDRWSLSTPRLHRPSKISNGSVDKGLGMEGVMVIHVDFQTFKQVVIFPPIEPKKAVNRPTSFTALEEHEQYRLHGILKKDSLSPLREDDATFLWNKRHFCTRISWALARVLQVAASWDWACLADIYALMEEWIPLDPLDALQLLHPRFADQHVRSKAVEWIQPLEDDELCDYLPQLVQALKYESYHDSALASFLIERALSSIRIAQYLYWYLHDSKHDHKFSQRAEMVLCALLSVCGRGLRQQFRKQDALMMNLSNIAEQVKAAKDSVRPHQVDLPRVNLRICCHCVEVDMNSGEDSLAGMG